MPEKKYIVKTTVHHDGEVFAPGDEIELNDKTAQPLLDVQAIAPAPEGGGNADDDQPPATGKKKK